MIQETNIVMTYCLIVKFVRIFSQIFKIENNHYLFLYFTKKRFWRPLLINVCLISIQQFSGHFSLTYRLQCLYRILSINEIIPTVIAILLLQVSISMLYIYMKYLIYNWIFLIVVKDVCIYYTTKSQIYNTHASYSLGGNLVARRARGGVLVPSQILNSA